MSYYGAGQASDEWVPVARPTAGSRVLLAVLVTAMVLVMCGGGVGALILIGNRTSSAGTAADHPTTLAASASNPRPISKNDCITITGSPDSPEVALATCQAGNYKVIERINGTGDKNRCNDVRGANNVYYYRTTPDSDSFVLCLQKLS